MINKTTILQTIKATLMLLFLFVADYASSQGINDMGLVWEKTYGKGEILNIKPNKAKDGYIACGYQSVQEGLFVEFDEAGKEIRRAVAPMTLVYTPKSPTATASFRAAFKTDDGGILAFGTIYDKGAPLTEKAPNWAGKPTNEENELLNLGVWIIKFDKNLNVVYKSRISGVSIRDGWQTSDGMFVVGGMDTGSTNFTLLRKYNQAGALVKDSRCNHREISSFYNFPGTDTFVASTPSVILRISAASGTVAVTSSKTVGEMALPQMIGPFISSISPSLDGGVFIHTNLNSTTHQQNNFNNGMGTYRLTSTYGVKYHFISKPAQNKLQAPLLLPGNNNPGIYVGVYQQCPTYNNCSTYMYELTDGATFNYTKGPAFPDGTALISVSTADGFFTCGASGTNAKIAKLSTCANFKVNNRPTSDKFIEPYNTTLTINKPINYEGAKASVKNDVQYSLTARVVTGIINGKTTGQIIETVSKQPVSSFVIASGKALDINKSYAVTSPQAKIEYTVTIHDNYTTSGVKQSCDQSYLFTFETSLVGGTTKGSTNVCYDTTPGELTVESGGGGEGAITYQWQSRANASATWVNASGVSTGEKYTLEKLKAKTHFQRIIKNSSGTGYSSELIVNVYPEVTLAVNQVNIDCFGEKGSITVSGASEYNFFNGSTWSGWTTTTNYTNLVAGTYKVKGKSTNNCEVEKIITITQPTAALSFTTNISHIVCAALQEKHL